MSEIEKRGEGVERVELVALGTLPGVGGATLRRLLSRFGSLHGILAATEGELRATPRIGPRTARAIRSADLERAAGLLRTLENAGIQVVTWDDAGYPAGLRTLPDAPPLLFARGRLLAGDDCAAAIVGTRAASERGRSAAAALAGALAQRGIAIVSGLAIGIDTAAHRGALDAGGRTLAVLGCGLRRLGSHANAELAARIAGQGAVVSEWHPDSEPTPSRLVARDRVISGLSRWVIVVESGEAGGSIRTAAFASRQGRVLAALPGTPGADALLAAGAVQLEWPACDVDALAELIRRTQVQRAPAAVGQMGLWESHTISIASPKL